jgi:hypothetical protein
MHLVPPGRPGVVSVPARRGCDIDELPADFAVIVEATARRVAELLRADPPVPRRFVNAHQLAIMLGVSRDWIYDHAAELGALRLGDGQRAPLRFDATQAVAVMASRAAVPSAEAGTGPPRPHRRGRSLIPYDEAA